MDFAQLEYLMRQALLVAYEQLSDVPDVCGVYTAWLRGEERALYVGRSKGLKSRIKAHFSGQRGSDQFCLYIYDRYVVEQRTPGLTTAEVNRLTAVWIRTYVQFRGVEVPVAEMGLHEEAMRRQWKPILNPL